ncbi:MAG: hypothetical protein ACRD2X_12680 [Vicinamibacteraceae bacterium]
MMLVLAGVVSRANTIVLIPRLSLATSRIPIHPGAKTMLFAGGVAASTETLHIIGRVEHLEQVK